MSRPRSLFLLTVGLAGLVACGGGGGGSGGDGGSSATRTTFTGNLTATTTAAARGSTQLDAALALVARLVAATHANAADVQVCVEDTSFCTLVDDDGFFTLAADVGGDVTLVFTGPDFVARVTLTDVPLGATVRLTNLRCSVVTGTCEPEDLEIEGAATRGPIRCQQGPIDVAHVGELVIDGHGEDCVRTEGQCRVTIEADRVVLQNCGTCVRTAGGSDVALIVGAGGLVCDADEDGIRASGNSAVHVDVAPGGDLDIVAGEVGIRSQGTALVEISGDLCRIEGDENALRSNGNAAIDTGACAAVDLVGGVGVDDDDDDDDDKDKDKGKGKDD
jgi:hypothetical protein